MADYQWFVQKNGPRAGQKYRIKRGASGLNVEIYQSGDTALQSKSRQPTSATTRPAARGLGSGLSESLWDLARKRRYNPNTPR